MRVVLIDRRRSAHHHGLDNARRLLGLDCHRRALKASQSLAAVAPAKAN